MEIKIYLKDPDGFSTSIDDYINITFEKLVNDHKLLKDMADSYKDTLREIIEDKLSRWVEYKENITLIYNTDTDTLSIDLVNKTS